MTPPPSPYSTLICTLHWLRQPTVNTLYITLSASLYLTLIKSVSPCRPPIPPLGSPELYANDHLIGSPNLSPQLCSPDLFRWSSGMKDLSSSNIGLYTLEPLSLVPQFLHAITLISVPTNDPSLLGWWGGWEGGVLWRRCTIPHSL